MRTCTLAKVWVISLKPRLCTRYAVAKDLPVPYKNVSVKKSFHKINTHNIVHFYETLSI